MRTPSDIPRRLPGTSRQARLLIAVGVVVLIILIASLSGLARFWTDYLWFQSVGFTSVFRGVLLTKVLLAIAFIAIFFVLLYVNLAIADRCAPEDINSTGADELVLRYRELVFPRARWVRLATAAIFAVLAGIGANREWNNWDLLRYHVNFGVQDPQFHHDVGFYVFELPFIKFLLGWFFEGMIIIFVITAVAHYLNGGIHLQGNVRRVTPAVKAHLSVLLGVLALIKGVDYYFQRLELVLNRSHLVNGATATNIHANLPALTLLIAIAVIAAGLFLYNIRQRGFTLPIVAVALWALVYILVGDVYPAVYQALRVSPSELTKETPYITRNINATRAAYGLNKVQVETKYSYSPTVATSEIQGTSSQAVANQQTLANVRVLDPAVSLKNTFEKYQAFQRYYSFNDLDLDRYVLDQNGQSQLSATIASVRELNGNVGSGFVNQHLGYTHGYGGVLAPVSQSGVNADGTPNFTLSDLPPSGSPSLSPDGSQVYFGVGGDMGGYVIAGSKTPELDYESPSKSNPEVTTHYTGKGGVDAGSIVRRAAFALRFRDANFLLSGQISPSSKVMFIRNINDRVRKAAPFLRYDSDPYAVFLGGKVYWVIDAYTTTDNYPYAQNAVIDQGFPASSGLLSTFDYVRNSVKVVVSAYDGSMHFFVRDDRDDPIIRVYERAFPDLFTPVARANSVIPGITAHFRYPEDLFRVQTNMYGRYHLTQPSDFYTQAQSWTVSPDPGSGPLSEATQAVQTVIAPNGQQLQTSVARVSPQYVLVHLPGATRQSFVMVSPFVPLAVSSAERQNLTAFMTASSDPQDYGTLRVYQTPPGQTVNGPVLAENTILSNGDISRELSLLNATAQGSVVELGQQAIVPIDDTLLYVVPIYVESSNNKIPELRDVAVVYNGTAYHSGNASLDNAICQIANPDGTKPFASYCSSAAASEVSLIPTGTASGGTGGGGPTTTTTTPSSTTTVPPGGVTVASLLAQAQAEFTAADAALKSGDLAGFQTHVKNAEADVTRAQQLASGH